MKKVMTVLGEVCSQDLGFCHCHEHLMLSKGHSYDINPVLLIDDVNKSVEEVTRFYLAGGKTIVDAQPGGCNRVASALIQISSRTKVNIIASTGFHKLIFYPESHWIYTFSEQQLYNIFLHELTIGMYTDIDDTFHNTALLHKAGIVKAALNVDGLTDTYQRLFRAAAHAAKDARVPLMVHIEKGSAPLALLEFLLKEGMPAKHIIFCHMDRAVSDLAVQEALLDQGIFAEYDTIGRFAYHDDAHEIGLFKHFIDKGYGEQLLFSLDTTRARLKAYTEDAIGLDYLLLTFVQLMKDADISETQIQNISHYNFINAFAYT